LKRKKIISSKIKKIYFSDQKIFSKKNKKKFNKKLIEQNFIKKIKSLNFFIRLNFNSS